MEKPDLKKLSASRIKTLQSCSWVYYCNYVLKLPQATNSGAMRGVSCHSVFELLLKVKRKKYQKSIVKAKSLDACPSVKRLVKIYLKKQKLHDQSEYNLVEKMIVVGLASDFYGKKGTKLFAPEHQFDIENPEPKYHIGGFIDKWGIDEKNKIVYIYDYKSSKAKFSGDERESNVQAMMYSLVAKKLYPEYKPVVVFIFLRFGDEPEQVVEFDDKILAGFEHYLEDVNGQINNFTYADALANLAADQQQKGDSFSGRLMCGFSKEKGELKKDGTPKWCCPYKFGFDYFAGLDKDGKMVSTAFDKQDLIDAKITNTESRRYTGCPRFNRSSLTSF